MPTPLQSRLPYDFRDQRPLPGIRPTRVEDWLDQDDAYAGQMAERDRLLRINRDSVVVMDASATSAAIELLDMIVALLGASQQDRYRRPDGIEVPIDHTDPMATLARLVQEDLCILQKRGDEHVLTAAALCFPAGWTLAEKFLKPLVRIHVPIERYDANVAKRVQRLFDGVQAGRPLWRFNALWYDQPNLHQPRLERDKQDRPSSRTGRYLRSERQIVLRLPQSDAVVFSIHTYVLSPESVTAQFGAQAAVV